VGAPPGVLVRADEEFTKSQNGDCHYEGQLGKCEGTQDRRDAEKRPGSLIGTELLSARSHSKTANWHSRHEAEQRWRNRRRPLM
jgi:hypothetical protein